jgi:hypothetical protein
MRYLVPVTLQTYFPVEADNEAEANALVEDLIDEGLFQDVILPGCQVVEAWTEGEDMVTT